MRQNVNLQAVFEEQNRLPGMIVEVGSVNIFKKNSGHYNKYIRDLNTL